MVKDEAETLEKTILSVKPIVDQVVIAVDRKSTDDTLEIAKKHADVLFEFDFKDNFSDIRNQLIKKSSGNWILIMDGHETFENPFGALKIIEKLRPAEFLKFRKTPDGEIELTDPKNKILVEQSGWEIIGIKKYRIDALSINLLQQEAEGNMFGLQVRFFRNIPKEIYYEDDMHNRLRVEPHSTLGVQALTIRHERSNEKIAKRNKQRSKMIMERMGKRAKENPDDLRAHYYLGAQYLANKSYIKSIKHFKIYIKKSDFMEQSYLAHWYMSKAFLFLYQKNQKRYLLQEFRSIMFHMMDMDFKLPLAYASLADVCYMEKQYAEAEHWYKAGRNWATSVRKPQVTCFFPHHFFTWYPWERLAAIYSELYIKNNRITDLNNAIMAGSECFNFGDFPEDLKTKMQECMGSWVNEYEKKTGQKLFGADGTGDRKSGDGNPAIKRTTSPGLPPGRLVKADMAG